MTNPYAEQPGDARRVSGPVFLESVKLGGPSGTARPVLITGSLPNPCHQLRLRIPARAAADGVWVVEAWSVSDPGVMCAQVLQPFAVEVMVPAPAARLRVNDQTALE
ncbi:MAG: hypothetical protein NTZ56_11760 [Acidobacteria bacterium]|nr:hypothetical protein [Acidobacteriota bacterium]